MSHVDILVFIVIGVVAVAALDWRVAKRFQVHERVEQASVDRLVQTAEVAADLAAQVGRDLKEMRQDQNNISTAVVALSDSIRMHDKRLGAVEERLFRAALYGPPKQGAGT